MNKLFFSLIIFILVSVVLVPAKLSAQQSSVDIQVTPANSQIIINQEQIIKITLSSEQRISAFDLKLTSNGPVKIIGFIDGLSTDNNFSPFDITQIKKEISGQNFQLAYILTASEEKLPKSVSFFARVEGFSLGTSKFSIDYNNSQVLNGSGRLLQVRPLSFDITATQNQSSPDFINPSSIPSPVYPPDTAQVNLTLNLFGALNPTQNIKATAVAVGRVGNEKFETQPQEFDLKGEGKGIFKGKVAFPTFKDGNKFSLMIKADKFLLKRICTKLPLEKKVGEYQCKDPSLTIKKGENSFNFSGISLLPGDLGLTDGFINGYDLALIRNNLNNNTAAPTADVNLDGLVNKKDLDIVSYALLTTSGRADQ